MTLRDKMKEIHPGRVNDMFQGGVVGCPSQYPELGIDKTSMRCPDSVITCAQCWSRPFVPGHPQVIHAHWKFYHKQNIAVCTHCSFERKLDHNFGKAVACPNCGTLMDE